MKTRCPWPGLDPLYLEYHDTEWGVPVYDDPTLFEFLILESAQAGLSWITILKKRAAYKSCFDNFNPSTIALWSDEKVAQAMLNPGIVRNRKKIESAVNNARCFLHIQEAEGSFSHFFWKFTDGNPITNYFKSFEEVPAQTPLSQAISKEMKRLGFNFIGPTICYAFMQAVGMVNDHLVDCFRHEECQTYEQE